MAERGKIGAATSPSSSTVAPSASATETAPRWRLSTSLPRVTSTRTGLDIERCFAARVSPHLGRERFRATPFPDPPGMDTGLLQEMRPYQIFFPTTWNPMASRLKTLRLTLLVVFALPIAARAGLYAVADHPRSWRDANWSTTGLLPPATDDPPARVLVFAARAGGWRSIFAVHTWIVVKPANAASYTRYDVMGFGQPVRINLHAPDAFWFSGAPRLVADIRGDDAARAIPAI